MALTSRAMPTSRRVFGRANLRPRVQRLAVPTRGCQSTTKTNLREILKDCSSLEKVRFIVIGDGAILESVNTFSSVRYNPVPGRGTFATIAVEDKSFECHINLSKVREVRFVKAKAKMGGHETYATRFLGEESKLLLSCLLHGIAGEYAPGAVDAWLAMQRRYGDGVMVEDPSN